ncbi:MAG TPA: gamma-glutamyltransferase, partial [Gemmatimonadaceae bacterium]|nr:gamma-glutamyltransferase [Gemmatimonadaceae bacterium]
MTLSRLALLAVASLAVVFCNRQPQPAAGPSMSATDVTVARGLEGTATYWGDRRPASFPAEWDFPARRGAVFGGRAMVVTDAPIASVVGAEIMRRGGNAVDAAVAVGFALAVVYPEAGNIGGGGYMVIRMADGRTAAIDYREVAPAAATRDMYLDAQGNLTDRSVVGPLASGVPGAVAGMVAALERFGSMPLRAVIEPAIQLADTGFVVDSAQWRAFRNAAGLIRRFEGGAVFYRDGQPPAPGSTLKQPALAATLRRIAERG